MLSLTDFFQDPRVVATVSDRTIDFKLNEQDPLLNPSQKDFLSKHIGAFAKDLFYLKQVHGNFVYPLTKITPFHLPLLKGDAMITNIPHQPLAVRTADCLSVFIFDPVVGAIGVVHAGWKGTHQEILKQTVEDMQSKWGSRPQDLKIAFGPSIRSCCYQVGVEFKDYFPDEIFAKPTGLYLDLPLANKRQLLRLGILEKNIFDCSICTCCNQRYFSYRRDGEKAGRMISVMMLKG